MSSSFGRVPDVTIGNDPEAFVVDMKSGKPIVAEKVFGPNKKYFCSVHLDDSSYHIDNVAIELNLPPNNCIQLLNSYLWKGVSVLTKIATEQNTKLCFVTAMKFPKNEIRKSQFGVQFGCEPSLLVSPDGDTSISHPNVDPFEVSIRSTGYHVHIGGKQTNNTLFDDCGRIRIAHMANILAGIPSVMMHSSIADRWRRTKLGYGKAGEIRPQPHGIEYRTLPGWIFQRPTLSWWGNAAVRDAYRLVAAGVEIPRQINMLQVYKTINTANSLQARKLWFKIKKYLIDPIQEEYFSWYSAGSISPIVVAAMNSIAENPKTFEDLFGPFHWPTGDGFNSTLPRILKDKYKSLSGPKEFMEQVKEYRNRFKGFNFELGS